jgi:succinate dehydrogenase/fumarate reductase cytochrome b subunit
MIVILFILAAIYFVIGLWLCLWNTNKILKQSTMKEHSAMDDLRIILLWPKEYKQIKNLK